MEKICQYKLILGFSVPFLLLVLLFGSLGKHAKADEVFATLGTCNWGEQAYNLQSQNYYHKYTNGSATTTLTAFSIWGWDGSAGYTDIVGSVWTQPSGYQILQATTTEINIGPDGGNVEYKMTLNEPLDLAPYGEYYFSVAGSQEYGWCRATDQREVFKTTAGPSIYSIGTMYNTAMSFYTESAPTCAVGYHLEEDVCVLTENAGDFFFDNPYNCDKTTTCKINYFYNEDIFTPYDYLSIYKYDSATSTNKTLIATSTIINFSMFEKNNGSSYFPLTGTSTYSGYTYYDVVGNLAESYNPITNSTTPATTTIPYMVVVNWGTIPPYDYTAQFASSSTSTDNALGVWTGLTTRQIACSEEEWNQPEGTTFFNFTLWKCSMLKTSLDLVNTVASVPKTAAKSVGNIIKNMFPFNIFVKINQSWNDSSAVGLPTDLAWINDEIDSDGNITIDPSSIFTETGTQTPLVIWGKDMFDSTSQWDIWRLRIRSVIGWIIWGAFIYFQIWKRAQRIKEDLENS